MAKKEVIYQGLSDLNVLIDDTTQYSPDYFRVTMLPGEFTAGINIFKFKGNPALFYEGSPVYIEVLDANGLPVYYEVGLDLESQEQTAIISVYINEDTVPGNGSITLCGQANQSSSGQILDASEINVRWSVPVYIDISKRNVDEVIFDELPEVSITATTGSYNNDIWAGAGRIITTSWSGIQYIYRNGVPVLYTPGPPMGSLFDSDVTNTTLSIVYGNIEDANQRLDSEVSASLEFTSSISLYSGSNIAYLTDPLIYPVNNSSEQHIVQNALINYMEVSYAQTVPDKIDSTENTHNIAIVQFSGLQPQVGEIAKIRSYYKSAGVQEYIFSNETDISDLADEFGFTANVVTASFALPTIHRNDKFDFKFEFVNPSGYVSKQVLEYFDVLFEGGNTYIGGDDNLITGSLYVAGATGTGVHISGKGSAAMIRSIGYEGFAKASAPGGKGGFVIYSGSVQPLLNASEQYTGVGIELFANTSSYFKYTTSGSGLLDIRTNQFFLGSTSQFISGANGNIEISSSNFHLSANGSVNMTGNVNITSGTGFATPAFVTSSIGAATSSLSSSLNSTISSVSSSLNSSITSVSSSISSSVSSISSSLNSSINSVSSSISSSVSSISSSLNSSILSVSSSISSSVSSVSSSLNSSILSVSSSISSSVSSISSSLNSSILSVSSSISSSVSSISSSLNSSILSVSSSLSSSLSLVSSSLNSTITSVSSSLNSSITSVSSSAAIALDRIVTDANNKIVKPNNTPSAGAGLYLSQGYLGYYSGSAWNAYISSSGEFLFKKNDNNQISFGNNSFVLKVSDAATISGSNINLLTPNFFLGSTSQFISGSSGNIEISSSNFHLSPTGDVDMAGDVNAVNGIFQNAKITGFVITGSGTAYAQASGLSSAFLLESWFTSSFVRNRASGNSTAALETKFNTGNRFNYGIFGWTASADLATAVSQSSNPLGYGYNVAAATYTGGGIGMASAGGWESTYVNPGPPTGFLKWKQASAFEYTQDYGKEYNGYGNEITASFLGANTGKVSPTVDTIVFVSPDVGQTSPFSITSSLIQIPSASLGYAFDDTAGIFKYNTDPIGLQFAMRMQSGSLGATGSPSTFKWSSNAYYDTFYVQCEIVNSSGSVLLTDRKYVYGADDWQIFNIPLTPALAETITGNITIHNPFRIIISWKHASYNDIGGRPFATTYTNLVRISELRFVQFPTTLGLKTDAVQFADSYFTSGNSGTQHFGSITPTTNNVYDIGIRGNQWRNLNAGLARLQQISLSDGIINSKYDTGGVTKPDSLRVYGGGSYELDQNLVDTKAFVVDYQGNTTMVGKVYIGQQPPDVQALNVDPAYLNITGRLSHALPTVSNDFQGEVNMFATTNAPITDEGDIFMMTWRNPYSATGEYQQWWQKASATSEFSGSGLLGIAFSKNSPFSLINGMGIRGRANFTGSSYQLMTSASGVMPGDKLYLSTTPGKFQNWAPTGSGEIVRIIGYCDNLNNYDFGAPTPVKRMPTGSIYFAPEISWIQNV